VSVLISDVQFSFRMSTECPLVDTKVRIAWSRVMRVAIVQVSQGVGR
jgi:hypothetical protein